ncbi:hypothetical protein, variant 2 [Exophiala mesophila]|uniref:Pet127-domain-containing protein n=1 Tax=Exophiala mesophila TaxID=212818 RepID=A0A0D1XSF1_EXOME|nr:uncharacterized protein PV10_05611 [Exophiala mesophila]XP_016222594.1 hypothetical protein, variant 1 [Exophiala mesophila]XP_016222595.1 hypothetical protein, variant 2 [Exophiala mesophila]KIV91019.1 hypothetical protein PV10_05611 [Exophiala mesophila]KIV91020.1 hypothetical protein, variant 1 [Exophiala mesophila]KIV91021.1 hypothetical protein, variant 2 [Exophiala mesophila]
MLITSVRQHVCLRCQYRLLASSAEIRPVYRPSLLIARSFSSSLGRRYAATQEVLSTTAPEADPLHVSAGPKNSTIPNVASQPRSSPRPISVQSSTKQQHDLETLKYVGDWLRKAWHEERSPPRPTLTIVRLLRTQKTSKMPRQPHAEKWIAKVEQKYAGQRVGNVIHAIDSINISVDKNTWTQVTYTGKLAQSLLICFGIIKPRGKESGSDIYRFVSSPLAEKSTQEERQMARQRRISPKRTEILSTTYSHRLRPRAGSGTRTELDTATPATVDRGPSTSSAAKGAKAAKVAIANMDARYLQVARSHELGLEPIAVERAKIPTLSFDLSRVLFNPGVYHLQDPRSRVWNFDPYLGKIMPVSEFNFDALREYITSSQDTQLRALTAAHKKRYSGSSSSLSGILSHFHFLLSGFRKLRVDGITRGFEDDLTSFTKISRSPSAIFLRYQDGVYAVDVDKEYDSNNILMSLGRSMEKLLTLPKEEFEQYRKGSSSAEDKARLSEKSLQDGEAYHYSEVGSFLLRSQLDCKDDRLPGSGVFDLKTRAVAGVRMMLNNHEEGMGYQIKSRHGTWESFEREYYDMMRSAFLKYSLQVRMGRMDGIFVAYHNIQRLFGFQYIPLPELDLALHGQTDESLGDREFVLSFKLLERIMDEATEKYPKQSMRFYFETREATEANPAFMYVFAEPMSEEAIDRIQNARKQKSAEYEKRLYNPQLTESEVSGAGVGEEKTEEAEMKELDEAKTKEAEVKELMGWKLTVRNLVNGLAVPYPRNMTAKDTWDVEHSLVPMDNSSAQRHYRLSRGRLRNVMEALNEERARSVYYIRRLVTLSQEGAEWRRLQDEYEATQKRILLYGGGDEEY